jgi:hypothetical protein
VRVRDQTVGVVGDTCEPNVSEIVVMLKEQD